MTASFSMLTGMQPSGSIHLGNYFGALENLKKIQKKKEVGRTFFMIADLHSLNTIPSREVLRNNILDSVAVLLACDVNANIFSQATVSSHSELALVFSAITSIGRLERMTQFKSKARLSENDALKSDMDVVNLGLLSYPVLQAADILLYDPDFVPVGSDQKQHIELARDIAQIFNRTYNFELFKVPEPVIDEDSGRIMSLTDGRKKMSKSEQDLNGCIYLTDAPEVVEKKIKKAKTDSFSEIYYDKDGRPEVANLIQIFALVTQKSVSEIEISYKSSGMGVFKSDLASAIIDRFSGIRKKIEEYSQDRNFLMNVLKDGMIVAKSFAEPKMEKVRDLIGLVSV